jgi:hypothetical protein
LLGVTKAAAFVGQLFIMGKRRPAMFLSSSILVVVGVERSRLPWASGETNESTKFRGSVWKLWACESKPPPRTCKATYACTAGAVSASAPFPVPT